MSYDSFAKIVSTYLEASLNNKNANLSYCQLGI